MPLSADMQVMTAEKWDGNGQYKEVVDTVKEAANGGEVKVYAVPRTQVKVEYWVVGVDAEGKKIVGVKALAVET